MSILHTRSRRARSIAVVHGGNYCAAVQVLASLEPELMAFVVGESYYASIVTQFDALPGTSMTGVICARTVLGARRPNDDAVKNWVTASELHF